MTSKTFSVPDIHCGGCAASIEGAVGKLDGVAEVKVTLDDHTVDVNFDDERRSAAARVIAEFAASRQVIYFTCHPPSTSKA